MKLEAAEYKSRREMYRKKCLLPYLVPGRRSVAVVFASGQLTLWGEREEEKVINIYGK